LEYDHCDYCRGRRLCGELSEGACLLCRKRHEVSGDHERATEVSRRLTTIDIAFSDLVYPEDDKELDYDAATAV
jgi:hypothetical protein